MRQLKVKNLCLQAVPSNYNVLCNINVEIVPDSSIHINHNLVHFFPVDKFSHAVLEIRLAT